MQAERAAPVVLVEPEEPEEPAVLAERAALSLARWAMPMPIRSWWTRSSIRREGTIVTETRRPSYYDAGVADHR